MTQQTTVTINKELLALAATLDGGFTKRQLAAIGVEWPPPKGWKKSVIGRPINRLAFEALMTARCPDPARPNTRRPVRNDDAERK